MRRILSLFAAATCCAAHAGPRQIDVLGLTPGSSSAADFKRIAKSIKSQNIAVFEIGGHSIRCSATYIDAKLALLTCPTGRRSVQYTAASNADVYDDLLKGFEQKFGKPDSTWIAPVRTRGGNSYDQNGAQWTDAVGNQLELYSMFNSVDMGLMVVKSAAFRRKSAQESATAESQKKFWVAA